MAPTDWVFPPPDPELATVRIVRTIGAEDDLRLESPRGEGLVSFKTEDLISEQERNTHAQFAWRRGPAWTRGIMVLHHEEYFVVRLAWGRLLVFDLAEPRLRSPLPSPADEKETTKPHGPQEVSDEVLEEILLAFDALALANLSSEQAEERRIAVTVCAARNLTEATPQLQKIARRDPGHHFVSTSAEKSRKVYFVREAAKEALRELEKTDGK